MVKVCLKLAVATSVDTASGSAPSASLYEPLEDQMRPSNCSRDVRRQ